MKPTTRCTAQIQLTSTTVSNTARTPGDNATSSRSAATRTRGVSGALNVTTSASAINPAITA